MVTCFILLYNGTIFRKVSYKNKNNAWALCILFLYCTRMWTRYIGSCCWRLLMDTCRVPCSTIFVALFPLGSPKKPFNLQISLVWKIACLFKVGKFIHFTHCPHMHSLCSWSYTTVPRLTKQTNNFARQKKPGLLFYNTLQSSTVSHWLLQHVILR